MNKKPITDEQKKEACYAFLKANPKIKAKDWSIEKDAPVGYTTCIRLTGGLTKMRAELGLARPSPKTRAMAREFDSLPLAEQRRICLEYYQEHPCEFSKQWALIRGYPCSRKTLISLFKSFSEFKEDAQYYKKEE